LYLISDDIYEWNRSKTGASFGLSNDKLYPYIKYIVNKQPFYNKVFDTTVFGGRFYGGGDHIDGPNKYNTCIPELSPLNFVFSTPLKQTSKIKDGKGITNIEYDFRVAIPRAGKISDNNWVTEGYGDRMKGKVMQCEMSSTSNSLDFSLQYITTKFRISWS
jgi:hypothetical protein